MLHVSVHPRTRGEHGRGTGVLRRSHGSSPHTRGTSSLVIRQIQRRRFIPAHAGNIRCRTPRPPCGSVHPRTRGEHMNSVTIVRMNHGSSPHTRGTWYQGILETVECRFIPAHAGNIKGHAPRRCEIPVHPRTRGEHLFSKIGLPHRAGSSPHTRGTSRIVISFNFRPRFIPAHAGNIQLNQLV